MFQNSSVFAENMNCFLFTHLTQLVQLITPITMFQLFNYTNIRARKYENLLFHDKKLNSQAEALKRSATVPMMCE